MKTFLFVVLLTFIFTISAISQAKKPAKQPEPVVPQTQQQPIQPGFYPAGVYDTIPSILLVSMCDTCVAKSMHGFNVRTRYVWIGARLQPLDYSDQLRITGFLNSKKTNFNPTEYVWYWRQE